VEGESVRPRPRAPASPICTRLRRSLRARGCARVCVPFGARVDAGLLSERPARGWWQIDATCQRYGCKFIATSAKEDKVNGKCQEAVDVASILSAYPQCRYP
jgi:hypothetical protein